MILGNLDYDCFLLIWSGCVTMVMKWNYWSSYMKAIVVYESTSLPIWICYADNFICMYKKVWIAILKMQISIRKITRGDFLIVRWWFKVAFSRPSYKRRNSLVQETCPSFIAYITSDIRNSRIGSNSHAHYDEPYLDVIMLTRIRLHLVLWVFCFCYHASSIRTMVCETHCKSLPKPLWRIGQTMVELGHMLNWNWALSSFSKEKL